MNVCPSTYAKRPIFSNTNNHFFLLRVFGGICLYSYIFVCWVLHTFVLTFMHLEHPPVPYGCLSAPLAPKRFCTLPNNEPVPQILKQVVNLSCCKCFGDFHLYGDFQFNQLSFFKQFKKSYEPWPGINNSCDSSVF